VFFYSFRKKYIGWSYFLAVANNWLTLNISQIFYSKLAFDLDPSPTYGLNVSDIYIFLKDHFIIYLIKKKNNLFVLKNSKFFEKIEGPFSWSITQKRNLTKHFRYKPSSGLSSS